MDSVKPPQKQDADIGTEMEHTAFRRSSLLARSPPPTSTTGTPMRQVKTTPPPIPFKRLEDFPPLGNPKAMTSTEDNGMEVETSTPLPATDIPPIQGIPPKKSPLRPVFEVQLLRQQQDDAGEEEASLYKKVRLLLRDMTKVLKTQKNVSNTIKNGIPQLQDFLSEADMCRETRLQAVRREREITNRFLSDRSQTNAMQDESKAQARKRPKRQRGSSSGSPELNERREEDVAPRPVLVSASSQTSPVSAAKSGPGSVIVQVTPPAEVPEPTVHPVSAPATALTPSGAWQTRLTKKERRKLKRAEVASQNASRVERTQVSNPVGEASGKSVRKPKQPRPKKPRTEAILIKPSGGRSFAEVLGQIRSKAKPEETDTTIKSIRRTQNGDVLLELGKSGDKSGFAAALKTALGDKGSIRALEPKSSVEVRDLDVLTTEEEVARAIQAALPEIPAEGLRVWLTKPNRSQLRMAVAEMGEKHANKLLSLQHLRVGWVSCRLKRRVVVARCFRCLGFGHSSRNCKGPDRSSNCFQCGSQGHTRKDCPSSPSCFLCKESGSSAFGHIPGSGQCGIFRAALEQAKGSGR